MVFCFYLPIFTTLASLSFTKNFRHPWQVLVANLFSHGEIGVDAIASPRAQPDADTPLGWVERAGCTWPSKESG